MEKIKKGKRQEQTEANRQRILEAAKALFAQKGYEMTSMRDISDTAQLPMGSLYYHFKNKEAMLLDICVDIAKTPQPEILEQLDEKVQNPYPYLFQYLDTYGDIWADAGEVFSYHVYEAFEHIYEQEHTWTHVPFYKNLRSFIEAAQQAGTMDRATSVEDTADYLFMMVRTLIYEWSQTKARHETIHLCQKYMPRLLHTFIKTK